MLTPELNDDHSGANRSPDTTTSCDVLERPLAAQAQGHDGNWLNERFRLWAPREWQGEHVAELVQFGRQVEVLVRASLLLAGFYQYDRGLWRRRKCDAQ